MCGQFILGKTTQKPNFFLTVKQIICFYDKLKQYFTKNNANFKTNLNKLQTQIDSIYYGLRPNINLLVHAKVI